MESKKSKIFTKKLVALFLAVLLAVSAFTGAMTAFAKGNDGYYDDKLAYNFLAWAETTDEQTAEALLDYADMYIPSLANSLLGSTHLKYEISLGITKIGVDGYLDSVDGILDIASQADEILDSYGGLIGGDVKNVTLDGVNYKDGPISNPSTGDYSRSASGYNFRDNNDAQTIILGLAQVLYDNSKSGNNVLREFIYGKFDLGTIIGGIVGVDLYKLIGDALGVSGINNWQYNMVYCIVANLIWENTDWYTDDQINAFKSNLGTDLGSSLETTSSERWVYDRELFDTMTEKLIQQINVEVTYQEKNESLGLAADSSRSRYSAITKYMADNNITDTFAGTVAYNNANGTDYDPTLIYTEEGNVYLFKQYTTSADEQTGLEVAPSDTLFDVAFNALKIAWETVLEPTIGLVHVNYSKDYGHGSNFDNAYYYWMLGENRWVKGDNANNYSAQNVQDWMADVCDAYGLSADEFESEVRKTLVLDRNVVDDAKGNWRDIDSHNLFIKLRYSPLADLYFDEQTGPINLYFAQLGTDEISSFFDRAFNDYSSIPAALNDGLVAACEALFPNSANIGVGSQTVNGKQKPVTNVTSPASVVDDAADLGIKTTGNLDMVGSGKQASINTAASTLINNACKLFEYAANTADCNIFNSYYTRHNLSYTGTVNLSEANFEEAAIPLLIACVVQNLNLTSTIHYDDWDKVKDAEGAAYLALEEYLSYVVPDRDYSTFATLQVDPDDGKEYYYASFDNILLMARDAIGYVIQAFVPVRDAAGNEWNIYDTTVSDTTSIWDMLNSVVVYYAGDYKYNAKLTGSNGTSGKVQSKSVSTLLGICDSDGNSLIQPTNSLWTNLDNAVNKLLPVVGELQFGSEGDLFNSYELIYNTIIKGILDISANGGGITNFVKQVYTIVCAEPISNTGIDKLAYDDILVPTVNALFGSRYGNGYAQVLPYSSYYDSDVDSYTGTSNGDMGNESGETASFAPFDSMVARLTICDYNGNTVGVLTSLITNIYEAFGGLTSKDATGPQGCWTGAMYAVSAVNNFIPSFVPQLSEHQFKALTAEVTNPSVSGVTAGKSVSSGTHTLVLENNAVGLNRAHNTNGRTSGAVAQDNRLYVKVTNITQTTSRTDSYKLNFATGTNTTPEIAPGETAELSIVGNYPSYNADGMLYTYEITYSVTDGEGGEALYTGLKQYAYLFVTSETGWLDSAYPTSRWSDDHGVYMLADGNEPTNGNETTYAKSTSKGGTSNWAYATFPKDYILKMSDAYNNIDRVNNLGFRVVNTEGDYIWNNEYRAFDGVYTYLTEGTTYYNINGGTTVPSETTTATADNDQYAYAAIDKSTGDLLNYDLYDYQDADGVWQRGGTSSATGARQGYTASEIENMGDVITRPHVAYTFDEALAKGMLGGVSRDVAEVKDNETTYVYNFVLVKINAGGVTFTDLLKGRFSNDSKDSITMGTFVPGLYLGCPKAEVHRGKSVYRPFLKYDGSTSLKATDFTMKVDVYTSSNNYMKADINVSIVDDTQANTLQNIYNSDAAEMASYQKSDLKTDNGAYYDSMQGAFQTAVKTMSQPINASNASKFSSTKIKSAKVKRTTDTLGDKAYKPAKVADGLPASIAADAYKKTVNGTQYYFFNEECTIPVYSNAKLEASDVTNGKNALGEEVAVGEDGDYYLVNAPSYDQEWFVPDANNTIYDYPILVNKAEQAEASDGSKYYDQIQFVYRDATGNKVTSRDNWAFKMAEGEEITKPYDGTKEYRGAYEQQIDNLNYWMEMVKGDVVNAADLIVEGISDDRAGLNNVNYIVAGYEKMVGVAKEAEKLVWVDEDTVSYSLTEDTTFQYDKTYYYKWDNNYYVETQYTVGDEVPEGKVYEKTFSYTTNASAVEIQEALRLYGEYKDFAIHRGYVKVSGSNRLEAEIEHASGLAYTGFDIAEDTERGTHRFAYSNVDDHQSDDVKSYVVTSTNKNAEVRFGQVNAETGVLENIDPDTGKQAFTTDSWNAYIDAIGEGINVADIGNKSSKTEEEVLASEITDCYTAKSHIIMAENNLTPFVEEVVGEGMTITGKIAIATSLDGSATDGIAAQDITVVVGDYTDAYYTPETLPADAIMTTSAADGTFTLTGVPEGTTALTIVGPTTTNRLITIADGATGTIDAGTIPVNVTDYNHSGGQINGLDMLTFNEYYFKNNVEGNAYYKYADLNGSTGTVNGLDLLVFNTFYFKGAPVYATFTIGE